MSLQAIQDAIHASGADQVREIEARARIQVDEILTEARIEARCLQEASRAAAIAPAAGERTRILHQARLEALQTVGDAREALVDEALSRARKYLADMRTDVSYPAVLRRLTEEALITLNGSLQEAGKTRLEADPCDRELLEGALFDWGLELPVSYELNCWGGLIAKGDDDRVLIINTLEARLARATPYLRHDLATLFEHGMKNKRQTSEMLAADRSSLIPCPSST